MAWGNRPETTLFADEGYLVPRYPQHVARVFISVSYDDRSLEEAEEHWRPYYEIMKEAINSFSLRWGGLDDATFLRTLREGNGRDKMAAIFAIGHSPLPQATDLLAPLLESPHLLERYAAASCMGLKRDERALPVLKEYLQSDQPINAQGKYSPETEIWYETYQGFIARVLATWGPASMTPILRSLFLRFWEREKKNGPGYSAGTVNDQICYALGRRGAVGALHGIELPAYLRRLAMVYLALGHIRADERFTDIDYEIFFNKALKQEVATVLAESFALSEKDGTPTYMSSSGAFCTA